MSWYELSVEQLSDQQAETISDWLEAQGALSVSLQDYNDDPILEPDIGCTPLWPEVQLSALFQQQELAQECAEQLQQKFGPVNTSIQLIADREWERVCMDQFQAMHFGGSLWICPSWCSPEDPNATNIMLDPGLAFGTGSHPTTALCLRWLAQNPPVDHSVIDYGCGSGILVIAARKLGATRIDAIDIDEQALESTRENAANNDCLDQNFHSYLPEQLRISADLIIANILLGPLQDLVETFKQHLHPQGKLVISGILQQQEEAIIEAYQQSFDLEQRDNEQEWSLLVFSRKNAP